MSAVSALASLRSSFVDVDDLEPAVHRVDPPARPRVGDQEGGRVGRRRGAGFGDADVSPKFRPVGFADTASGPACQVAPSEHPVIIETLRCTRLPLAGRAGEELDGTAAGLAPALERTMEPAGDRLMRTEERHVLLITVRRRLA